jgi:TPR repeat protein
LLELCAQAVEQGNANMVPWLAYLYAFGFEATRVDVTKAKALADTHGSTDASAAALQAYLRAVLGNEGKSTTCLADVETLRMPEHTGVQQAKLVQGVRAALVGWCLDGEEGGAVHCSGAERCRREYVRAAELGHAYAQYRVGRFLQYPHGTSGSMHCGRLRSKDARRGTPEQCAAAVTWYIKSAAQGCAQGQRALGACYEHGEGGVDVDAKRALELYQAAAAQGDADAECSVGYMHERGHAGLRANSDIAQTWYERAARRNYPRGLAYLADLLRDHKKGDSKRRALALYTTAAERGFSYAQFRLAVMYDDGCGGAVPQDTSLAVQWYQRAAAAEHGASQFYLAECYQKGRGTDADECKAEAWYRAAAANGYPSAKYVLGMAAKDGTLFCYRGKPQPMEAREWLSEAAAAGHDDARKALHSLPSLSFTTIVHEGGCVVRWHS